ncbi:zinc finger protein [Saccharopolyspora sp. CA-218241]|uniref:zinc finger protein n=1 Tax=Saccharopolyspora sp. CA-218241 TaxID=3240027 RepID=UPI003D99C47B
MCRLHPFHWVPADGERHATTAGRPLGGYSDGTVLETLCGRELRAVSGELAWLWFTCPDCDHEAHRMAGAPLPRRHRSRVVPSSTV